MKLPRMFSESGYFPGFAAETLLIVTGFESYCTVSYFGNYSRDSPQQRECERKKCIFNLANMQIAFRYSLQSFCFIELAQKIYRLIPGDAAAQ